MDYHGKQTSIPKGNGRSPESNVPRSNVVFFSNQGKSLDFANQTGIEKTRSFDHPQAELDILSFQKHINKPWKPEARNRTRPRFYTCPGYQQL